MSHASRMLFFINFLSLSALLTAQSLPPAYPGPPAPVYGSPFPPSPAFGPCDICEACLVAFQPLVKLSMLSSGDAEVLVDNFKDNCTALTVDEEVCSEVGDGLLSGIAERTSNAIGRAGVLCSLIGLCNISDSCTTLEVSYIIGNGGAPLNGSLDLCAAEGVVGGQLSELPSDIYTNASCFNDTVCSTGASCDIPDVDPPVQCTCESGMDICKPFGTCVGFCKRSSTITQLELLNEGADVCASDADCDSGSTCTPMSQSCSVFTCDETTQKIVKASCTGRCTPTSLTVVAAQLENNGRSLVAILSAPAATLLLTSCESLFTSASFDKLGGKGAGALCNVVLKELVVTLPPSATLKAGDVLELASETKLVGAFTRQPFTGNFTVGNCSSCAVPTAIITGPMTIVEPCEGSENDMFAAASSVPPTYDASMSIDPSGRSTWDQVSWSLDEGIGDAAGHVILQDAVGRANNYTDMRSRLVLSLTADDVLNLTASPYRLKITVKSWLGTEASASINFKKAAAAAVPAVSINGPAKQSFQISSGLKLSAEAGQVCKGQKVDWKWSSTWTGLSKALTSESQQLYVPGPVTGVVHGQTIVITVDGSFDKFANNDTDNVTLVAIGSAPVAVLKGPNGDVTDDKAIVLDATASYDPDNTSSLKYTWSCRRVDQVPCFLDSAQGNTSVPGVWNIPAKVLTNDVVHVITVEVDKPANATGTVPLTTPAFVAFRPRSATAKFPRGVLSRQCGGAGCIGAHSTAKRLTLLLELADGFSGSTVTWSSEQIPNIGSLKADTSATGKTLPANVVRLNIPSSYLPTTQSAVTIIANMSFAGETGMASVIVPLDSPPSCGLNPANTSACFNIALVPGKDTFPLAVASIRAEGLMDAQDSQLRYEFGVGDPARGEIQQLGTSSSATIVGLRKGTVQLYGCAIDSGNSRVCGTGQVVVKPPGSSFNASAALSSVDVDSLVSGNDAGAILKAASQMSLLLEILSSSSSSSGGSGSGGVNDAVTKIIAAQSEKLVAGLMSNVANMDGDQAKQVASSLSGMAKSSGNSLSDSTKGKYRTASTDLVNAAVGSGSATPKKVDSGFGDNICTMFGISKPGSSGSGSSSSGRRRLLQQQDATTWLNSTSNSATMLGRGMASEAIPGGDAVSSGGSNVFVSVSAVQVVGSGNAASGTLSVSAGPAVATTSTTRRAHRRMQGLRQLQQTTSSPTSASVVLSLSGAAATAAAGYTLNLIYLSNLTDVVTTALGSNLPSNVALRSGVVQLSWIATVIPAPEPPVLGGANSITLSIPTSGYDPSKIGTCMSYNIATNTLTGLSLGANPATFVSYDVATGLVTCTVTAVGAYVVGQGPESVYPSPPPPSPYVQQVSSTPGNGNGNLNGNGGDDNDGLTGGQIAGIVVGTVVGAILTVALVVAIILTRRRAHQVTASTRGSGGGAVGPVAEALQRQAEEMVEATEAAAAADRTTPSPVLPVETTRARAAWETELADGGEEEERTSSGDSIAAAVASQRPASLASSSWGKPQQSGSLPNSPMPPA